MRPVWKQQKCGSYDRWCIPWTDDKTNDNVLYRAGTERHLLMTVRIRQAEILGHVIRKSHPELLVKTDKFESKKGQED